MPAPIKSKEYILLTIALKFIKIIEMHNPLKKKGTEQIIYIKASDIIEEKCISSGKKWMPKKIKKETRIDREKAVEKMDAWLSAFSCRNNLGEVYTYTPLAPKPKRANETTRKAK
ncbi:hypothetical protein CEE39_04730 [bacterium (candidate division B38) B3_B38]|nr:MAG: hypothetical protein CEE39_04730 [bacterium (candidate division B38) B3_B38]